MRTRFVLAAVALSVGVTAADRLIACGDKYLNLGLGTRFARSAAERRAAAVLLHAPPGSDLSRLLTTLSIEDAMRKAGYQPTVTTSQGQLDEALRPSHKWDVIVLAGQESAAVSRRVASPTGPHLVPVLAGATKDELKQARKLYETVLDSPTKSRVFVETVDDALDLHEMEVKNARKH